MFVFVKAQYMCCPSIVGGSAISRNSLMFMDFC